MRDMLNKKGIVVPKFTGNLPGRDWAYGFLKRFNNVLTTRSCQNICRAWAAVNTSVVLPYLNRAHKVLKNIPAANILNYDETNFTDDPKASKCCFEKVPRMHIESSTPQRQQHLLCLQGLPAGFYFLHT